MGKADKQTARNMNSDTRANDITQGNQGIDQTNQARAILQPETNQMRDQAFSGYRTASDPNNSAFSTAKTGQPSYIGTFNDISGKDAGLDWSGVDSGANALANTRGNYGATDKSIKGLQDFAATGGINSNDMSAIDNPLYKEFEKTGGYSADDLGNIRSRGNSAIASTYGNMADTMKRGQAATGQMSPGFDAAGFKMMRQGAQDIGTNARDTEANIAQMVQSGRIGAANAHASNILNMLPTRSNNTLQGYGSSGNMDLTKNRQVDEATQNSVADYLQKNGLINQSRLSAAGGLSSDALTRAGGMDASRNTGLAGIAGVYGKTADENANNNQLQYNYQRGLANDLNQTTQNQLEVNKAPGIMSDIGGAIDLAGAAAPMISGIPNMFKKMGGNTGITGGSMNNVGLGSYGNIQ